MSVYVFLLTYKRRKLVKINNNNAKKTNIKVTECVNTNSLKKNQFLLFSFSWIFLSTISMLMLFSIYIHTDTTIIDRPSGLCAFKQLEKRKIEKKERPSSLYTYVAIERKNCRKENCNRKGKTDDENIANSSFTSFLVLFLKLFAVSLHFMSMLRLFEFS